MVLDARSSWRPARVILNRPVANGSMWITLEAMDELPAAFEPGHVLGLGLRVNEHSLVRHAYTVSRGASDSRRFEHLYRVIPGGRVTPLLAQLSAEDTVYFQGPFHTPIQKEIQPGADRIMLISTGAGIGPLFGYANRTLAEGESRPISLYAGFREESHTCLAEELTAMALRHSNFDWHFTLTQPPAAWHGLVGRVTECVPGRIHPQDLGLYHFHLVGNGEMVHLMRRALHHAGVSTERVSIETYFNHNVYPPNEIVERLAGHFRLD